MRAGVVSPDYFCAISFFAFTDCVHFTVFVLLKALVRIGQNRWQEGTSPNPKILHTLPDEGYDSILLQAVEKNVQDMNGSRPFLLDLPRMGIEPPNTLSALLIAVTPEHRSRGLADIDILIMAMKQTAMEQGYEAMMVPLRITYHGRAQGRPFQARQQLR